MKNYFKSAVDGLSGRLIKTSQFNDKRLRD
jgi:hypothetical protein